MSMKLNTLMAAVLCVFSTHSIASEDDKLEFLEYNNSAMEELFSGDMDQGFKYQFAGDAEEEGALKLFIKNTASDHDLHNPDADTFSRISPAAGIQLQFDF